jgi:hypothetical protein
MRNPANFFASGGVKNSKRFASSGITPLAVDEKLGIGVGHVCSFKFIVISRCKKTTMCRNKFHELWLYLFYWRPLVPDTGVEPVDQRIMNSFKRTLYKSIGYKRYTEV